MIRTDSEYREAMKRLQQDLEVMAHQRQSFRQAGLTEAEVEHALEPILSFHAQLAEEVTWYEKVKRREFGRIENLAGLGQWLIALRIANGLSQAELARRLSVSETQVSRDERNEYHGITLERAERILDSLGEKMISHISQKQELENLQPVMTASTGAYKVALSRAVDKLLPDDVESFSRMAS
jgi:transcriptional regulator with XRE-family HTH domain